MVIVEVTSKKIQENLCFNGCFQDEKEQLLQYRSTVAGLVGRAKNIVQLRPRSPESPLRCSIPVKAICDYRQIEVQPYLTKQFKKKKSPFRDLNFLLKLL